MKFELEKEFAENTTLHGISRIFNAGGVLLKLLWTTVFLVAFGLFVWQFTDRLSTYLDYNYNTLVEVNLSFRFFFLMFILNSVRNNCHEVLSEIVHLSRIAFKSYF